MTKERGVRAGWVLVGLLLACLLAWAAIIGIVWALIKAGV